MPYVMNYDNLLTTVGDYLERSNSELSSNIPVFIRLCEKKVARILKAQLATISVTDSLTQGSPLVTKPDGWIENLSFSITVSGQVILLKKRERENIQVMYPSTTDTGVPKYYAEWQENYFYLGPTPDSAYPFELTIYQEPTPLDAGNQTNYLTETAPDLMLYGTLLEAQGYLKDDDRIPVWKAAYDDSVQMLTGLDIRRQTDRQQVRSKGA